MRLALVIDHANGFDLHEVADDRRLRALVEMCSKGWSRSADSVMEELGAEVAEAAADAIGVPFMGVAHGPAAARARAEEEASGG